MQYRDWGSRSPRWTGIRSDTAQVDGIDVHFLRAEAGAAAPLGAPTHLLLHSLGASATFMLDLIGPLTTYGPVVAPDLQGSLFGETTTPRPKAARMEANARFLRKFTSTLGLDQLVVHGWSMGGGVAIHFAAISSDRVERLVLANPPLPAPLTRLERAGWQTLGRLALVVGPILARWLVRFWGRKVIDRRLRYLTGTSTPRSFQHLGADVSRIAPDTMALWTEQIAGLRLHPERMGHAATAFASVVSDIFVNQQATWDAIDRITTPVLLLWGEEDPLITRPMIDQVLARHPEWDLHVFPGTGHSAPVEVPDQYVRAVGEWLGRNQAATKTRSDWTG